ncbi:MAG: CvpA family protein [Rhodobacteraceae bacterium]|nr:CvpA family protein [Paracoccaceae bacterium]
MSGLNYFDIFALVLVLVSGAFAYSRGFAREVMSILGWVVSAVVAYLAAPLVAPLMNSIPYLGNIVQHSCELGVLGAFAVTFAITLIASTVINSVVLTVTKLPGINMFNRTLGLLFGILRGGFILTIILLVVDSVLPTGGLFDAITQSNSAEIFQYSKNLMKENIPNETPDWVTYVYQNLMASCNVIVETTADTASELPTDDLTSDELPQE